MKKLKSSLTNMVLVLTGIAIVAGFALAYINSVTAQQIKDIEEANLKAGLKEVLNLQPNDSLSFEADTLYYEGKEPQQGAKIKDDDIQFIIYKTPVGVAVMSKENGFGGKLCVLTGFQEDTISGYKVLKHAETPGLGAKAGKWFQKDGKGNIIGKTPDAPGTKYKDQKFKVSKDTGGEVDAITASTITSRAFLAAVQSAYEQYVNSKNK